MQFAGSDGTDEQIRRILSLHPLHDTRVRSGIDGFGHYARIEQKHQNTFLGFWRFRGGSLNSGTLGADSQQSTSVRGLSFPVALSPINRTSNFSSPRLVMI
jgi:hypothetical protein